MTICRFLIDGFWRYKREHGGELPLELVLHRSHLNRLVDEMAEAESCDDECEEWSTRGFRSFRSGLADLEGVVLLADTRCEVPYFVSRIGEHWEL